mgnify:CR=1 FL=1
MRPVEVINKSWVKDKAQIVEWNVTRRCNFNCSYCDDTGNNPVGFHFKHDSISKHPSLETMISIIDGVERLGYYDIGWALSGGEPLTVPHIYEVLKYLRESEPYGISVVTNGSVGLNRILKCFELLDHLIVSFHFEFTQNRTDEYFNKIVEIDKISKDTGKKFTPRFLLYPGEFDYFRKMHARLLDAGVQVAEFRNIIPLPGSDKMYTQEEEQDILWWRNNTGRYAKNIELLFDDGTRKETYPDEITLNNWNKFKEWTCSVGINQIHIGPNGEVYRGTCRAGGQLGNITDPNFKMPTEPITCPFETCIDYIDISTPKHEKA